MENEWVDFKVVKASVTMQQVLDHYGIRLRKVNATHLRGKCPLPMHSSQGSADSFGVDLQKRAWACQSDSCAKARSGRRGGNVLDFVAAKEGLSVRDSALKLASLFGIVSERPEGTSTKRTDPVPRANPVEVVQPEEGSGDVAEPNKPLKFSLQGIDATHAYLVQRGINEETARLFGVGYFQGNGSMKGRIVFPVRNGGGDIVAYAGRAVDDAVEPRWKFPSGFRKSLELFGIQEGKRGLVVAVVESFWGVLALHQAGISAVALMGRSMSKEQEELLASVESTARLVVLVDGDEPGRAAAPEITLRLARHRFVRIAELPIGKQPDHFQPDELRALLAV
jgi:DNA primase